MSDLDRLELANRIAKSAGQVTLKYFQTDQFSVDYKGDGSPLTVADREAETHIREQIEAHFPDDAIQGEEFPTKPGTSGFGWILDPIDGTKSFISGVPLYGTMIAVEKIGPAGGIDIGDNADQPRQAIIGSVYFPGLDEGMYAARGHGAFSFKGDQEPIPAKVSQRSEIGKSVLLTTSVSDFELRQSDQAFAKLANEFYFSRTWGDVYGYYLVAIGRAEAMVDPELNIWDVAAVQPIIEEAGGRFSDWNGDSKIDTGDAVGSNGKFHDEILRILNSQK
ncbi:inositol monophosphatase [Mariniblastus sp.]|nr:inositol monophosphatase [Mariniblastus sp.]